MRHRRGGGERVAVGQPTCEIEGGPEILFRVNDDTPGGIRRQRAAPPPDPLYSTLAPITYGLGEELIADGARRLIVVAGTLAAVGHYLAGPDGWGWPGHAIALLLVGLSAAVVVIARSRRFEPRLVLDLALLWTSPDSVDT